MKLAKMFVLVKMFLLATVLGEAFFASGIAGKLRTNLFQDQGTYVREQCTLKNGLSQFCSRVAWTSVCDRCAEFALCSRCSVQRLARVQRTLLSPGAKQDTAGAGTTCSEISSDSPRVPTE